MTHREYAETNEVFKLACELAKVKPTMRQASKFRNNRGLAFVFKTQTIEILEAKKQKEIEDNGKE